jgi:hypothetical protein
MNEAAESIPKEVRHRVSVRSAGNRLGDGVTYWIYPSRVALARAVRKLEEHAPRALCREWALVSLRDTEGFVTVAAERWYKANNPEEWAALNRSPEEVMG